MHGMPLLLVVHMRYVEYVRHVLSALQRSISKGTGNRREHRSVAVASESRLVVGIMTRLGGDKRMTSAPRAKRCWPKSDQRNGGGVRVQGFINPKI